MVFKICIKIENFQKFCKILEEFHVVFVDNSSAEKFSENFFSQNVAKLLAENSAEKHGRHRTLKIVYLGGFF